MLVVLSKEEHDHVRVRQAKLAKNRRCESFTG
jgi:hypothetical protein